ncbi:hypothetical protein GCM10018789_49830 [Streptomyces werraensis]|nr:hypothetical protein GCM10018789_49830 [Streptomyces werraensis]
MRCGAQPVGGPPAHRVRRRLPRVWGAKPHFGTEQTVGTETGPRVPRAVTPAAPGCESRTPGRPARRRADRDACAVRPGGVRGRADAGSGVHRVPRRLPRPGSCRRQGGEGGTVLGGAGLGRARVSASGRRAVCVSTSR